MQALTEITSILTGHFDNRAQLLVLQQQGIDGYPYAEHINTPCNGKISGLPMDFPGIFLLEESYYTVGGHTNAMPHLFLFTQEGQKIKLTSYEIPQGYTKQSFCFQNLRELSYSSLQISAKFTPAYYHKEGDSWVGGSVSMFSPVMKFTLWERFSPEVLLVSECIEVNGKRVFGYDLPLEYRRKPG